MDNKPQNPSNMKMLTISADEIDYLTNYYEIRDHGKLFAFATKLLHDLTKAEESGWHTILFKGEYKDTGYEFNPNYFYAAFKLDNLTPSNDGKFMRIDVELLESKLKKPTNEKL
jgi:hypothetical protein